MAQAKKNLIQKQKPMTQVLLALTPLCLAAIYFYGWYFLLVLAVVNLTGFICEYLFLKKYNQPVSSAVFVTGFIFALSLPPTIPLWIAVAGIAFGVVFGKMVFGGFGRNIFNPAVSGRAFIYISFGGPLTGGFVNPFSGLPGGYAAWQPSVDALTKATPLYNFKVAGGLTDATLMDLFLGNIPGSYGEVCAALIIVFGLYLIIRKVASLPIVAGGLFGFLLFQLILWKTPGVNTMDPFTGLLSGTILFGLFFMATDPVSASQTTDTGRWIYGILVGSLTSLIRTFSIWPEGFTFALLLGNMFAPLIDQIIKIAKQKTPKKAKGV